MTKEDQEAPKNVKYAADVREQRLVLPGPEFAERIRQFLAQHEVDTVVYVPEEGWIYLRKRAMAVEQTDSITSATVPDNVTAITEGKKSDPPPDEPPSDDEHPTA